MSTVRWLVIYENITDSMRRAIHETNRRRQARTEWNSEHGIDSTTVRRQVSDILELVQSKAPEPAGDVARPKNADRSIWRGTSPVSSSASKTECIRQQRSSGSNTQPVFGTKSTGLKRELKEVAKAG
jgi:excinuclease UvrABC helicase subunit UvrB